MIEISTHGDHRRYLVPRALLDVAVAIFPDEDHPVFKLARQLVADDLHTCEQIALNRDHAAAVSFARSRLVERRFTRL